ncbi:MAG TPA: zinc-dependent alcohol dehydrogenase [Desulfuromonadaceae bacterium]
MKAVVWQGVGDIRLEDVVEPKIEQPTDAIVKLTASAICGTDLHMVRGTLSGMKPGTILGHEGVGIVEQVGSAVRNLKPGDRVLIPSTIACGYCSYCRAGYYAQCDNANPNGMQAGTCFFGGPERSGAVNGLQAEKARIPFAGVGLVKLTDGITDEQAILISDIFPTGYMGAELAEIKPGNMVAIFGCGPVGQFAIASAKLFQAGRIFAIDCIPSRLETAKEQGAEVIDFSKEDPVQVIRELTGGIGCDRAIDAVGVDAEAPHAGPAMKEAKEYEEEFKHELSVVAPQTNVRGENWRPGDAPSMTLIWGVECLAKAGTFSIIGVYPDTVTYFPIGLAMNKNLTLKMGNCNHRKYIPFLIDLVRSGTVDPVKILTKREPLTSAVDAYRAFDLRKSGWLKVELQPREMVH